MWASQAQANWTSSPDACDAVSRLHARVSRIILAPGPVCAVNGVWRMLLILFFSCCLSAVMMGGTEDGGPCADEVTPRCDTSRPNQNTAAAHAQHHRQPEHAFIVWFEHEDKMAHM